jgi:hypothetical protein
MIGVCISIYFIEYSAKYPIKKYKANLCGLFGLAMLIASINLYNKDLPYPSAYTLLPTLWTSLILLSKSKKQSIEQAAKSKVYCWHGAS